MKNILTPRLKAAIQYLSWADPLYTWRIGHGKCGSCGGRFFLSMRPDAFMTRCLKCSANGVNLALIEVINQLQSDLIINDVWEMSTYGATLDFHRRTYRNVTSSEFFPGVASGVKKGSIICQDVQATSFDDETFDLVTSNQVMEHVPNDIAGYEECYRILRPGGIYMFTVPLYDIPETIMRAEIISGELIHHFEPEYHNSRLDGPTALTFWHHSRRDILKRVGLSGFKTQFIETNISSSQKEPYLVIVGIK